MSTLRFYADLLEERLWFKPALYAVGAAALVLIAILADGFEAVEVLPQIETGALDKLLTIISSSMLGVATFAVASMVAAFASASNSATPRAFKLVIADNMSQRALSAFVGAYIFSIIALISVESDLLARNGNFVLFGGIVLVQAWVILTFVRWVDNIARLGRMGDTIAKVHQATVRALADWAPLACLPGRPAQFQSGAATVTADRFGHIQHIKMDDLAEWAETVDARLHITTHPGAFVSAGENLAEIQFNGEEPGWDEEDLRSAFVTGLDRSFNCDPRFGLIALSEIASRALSPGVNDPGTAIDVIKRLMVIFREWETALASCETPKWSRLTMDPVPTDSIFNDAFHGIERDGARLVEVGVWLQRCYGGITEHGSAGFADEARNRARSAIERAESSGLTASEMDLLARACVLDGTRRANS